MHLKHLLGPSLLASALLLSAGHALAGTDLSVSGHIRPRGACSLALGNGGTFDQGTISRKDLKEAEETPLNRQSWSTSLNIHCQTPTKVALRMFDNRAGTSTSSNAWAYGLGASGGKNVGRLELSIVNAIGDGKARLNHLRDAPGSEAWDATDVGWFMRRSWLYSWAEKGQTLPQAFQDISGELQSWAWIAPAKDLDLSQEIAIDGSATMELVYL